jgi:hypothetical protein
MPVPRPERKLVADFAIDLGREQGKRWLVAGVWGMSPHMMFRAAESDLHTTTTTVTDPLRRALAHRRELFFTAYVMGAMEEMLRPKASMVRNLE